MMLAQVLLPVAPEKEWMVQHVQEMMVSMLVVLVILHDWQVRPTSQWAYMGLLPTTPFQIGYTHT